MLFSDAAVASFVNENFEPAWESVRAVPIVHIDFGDRRSVTRTLHGNVATHICNARGNVLDILPGTYDAATYLSQLEQLIVLSRSIANSDQSLERLREYHAKARTTQDQDTTRVNLRAGQAPPTENAPDRLADFSKVAIIEKPIEVALRPLKRIDTRADVGTSSSSKDMTFKSLKQDARYNELYRRRAVHERLSRADWTMPREITKWLYREVLDTDLDDPHLGLTDLLFANYPFTAEDG